MSTAAPIVLALAHSDAAGSTAGLEWAAALAGESGAPLRAVLVLPPTVALDALFPAFVATTPVGGAAPARDAVDAARAWWANTGPASLLALGSEVSVRVGGFVEEVAHYAEAVGAALVVISCAEARPGRLATRLVRAAGRPVLVARAGPGTGGARTVVAATDLADTAYPVLRLAARLSAGLHLRLIAVHNLAPLLAPSLPPAGDFAQSWPTVERVDDQRTARRLEDLSRASRVLSHPIDPVVAHGLSPSETILAESGRRETALVVVGTRARSWLRSFLCGSTAERVVNRSRRAVLLTPLPARVHATP